MYINISMEKNFKKSELVLRVYTFNILKMIMAYINNPYYKLCFYYR